MDATMSRSWTEVKAKKVDFRLAAPQAKAVNVCGTFNQWRTNADRLTKDAMGTWKGTIQLKPGKYEYRFFVDGQWNDDPGAGKTVANKFGSKNAVLEVK